MPWSGQYPFGFYCSKDTAGASTASRNSDSCNPVGLRTCGLPLPAGLSSCHAACQRVLRSGDLHVLERAGSPVAHFHAYHAGRRASVSIDGNLLAGRLEPRALQFVREWASLRHEEILANWERARENEPLLAIPPLP